MRIFDSLRILYNNMKKKPEPLAPCKIVRMWKIENDTVRYRLAQESLIEQSTDGDFTIFTDNGDLSLSILFYDLEHAYAREIRHEQMSRLRVIQVKRKR